MDRAGPALVRPHRSMELAAARPGRRRRVGLAVLGQVPLIVIPLVLAAVAAATMAPGGRRAQAPRADPNDAALAMTVGGFGLILIILVLTLAALAGPISEIVDGGIAGAGKIDDALAAGESLASIIAAFAEPSWRRSPGVRGLAGLGISVVLGAILTFFLLRDGAIGFEAVTSPLDAMAPRRARGRRAPSD